MTARWAWGAALIFLCVCLDSRPARNASVFEELVSPGPVVEGHAKLESDCASCHKPFDKAAQRGLCLDCHKPIAADVGARLGFHGRQPTIATTQACSSCHTDHAGRAANIIKLESETFDHDLTDFPLSGGHIKPVCEACHQKGRKFRDAPIACIGCHQKDDVHKGSLGADCSTCHSAKSWKSISFDHDRDTKYPLTGKHRKVKCAECHRADTKVHPTPTTCLACHEAKDPHKGNLGPDCQACHVTRNWKKVTFDHGQSAFPLLGMHAKAKCADCHKTSEYKKTPMTCISCHEDKHHQGRLGSECARCHNAVAWKLYRFNHARDANYPLTGRHARIACTDCHAMPNPRTLELPVDCIACHRAEDVHKGKFGADCARCHRTSTWKRAYITP